MIRMRMKMPINQKDGKWYWGSKGPFNSKKKAEEVAQAAHASGYVSKLVKGFFQPNRPTTKKKSDFSWVAPMHDELHGGPKSATEVKDLEERQAREALAPLKRWERKRNNVAKLVKFIKEDGGGGGEGGAFTSADVGTPTYGSNRKKKQGLKKAKDVMFTSTVDAEEAFENPNSRLKDKTGVERADKFLNDLSPEMKAMDEEEEKEVRRKLPNVGMGISSRDSSTIPTHSHATSFNKSFVVDLVKWVTQELRKESDPYANYRLPNEDPSRPFQEGEQAWRKDKKKSPTTEDTVPNIPNPNDGMRNMGLAGSMEDSKPGGAGTPGPFDPWAANNAKVPKATKKTKGLEKVGVTVETPYQQGNNMQAMQKVSVGGGSPHILTMVQPRTGSEENPQYVEKKGEIDLTADAKEDDIVNANKERRKRDKEAEVSQEPPLAVAGAMAGQIDNPVQQLMLKTEFGINPDDALHRGGDLDKDRKIPIDDEDIENSKEVEKELYKMIQNSVNGWFTKRNKENE